MKQISIPELNIKVDTEFSFKENCWEKCKIPEGKDILTFAEIAFLYENDNYRKLLKLDNTYEFFGYHNKNRIGVFSSRLDWADFGSGFYADDRLVGYASSGLLGVRLIERLK